MAEVSQKTKYVKLDDGVSFSLVRTNPKLTTNTKLMYNGKKMYMESYASSELLNRVEYKNFPVKQNSTYNKDISNFLEGSGSQAYSVYQNFSNIAISDSYDNQFETIYWCGAEYIDSSFYTQKIGFIAPLYLREKLPNYFLIFRLDTPSNYNFNKDSSNNVIDSSFDFKTDILDKAVLIKTFDLREGTVLGNYIHNYVDQDSFEYDTSMYVNFTNCEVTYYGINKFNGILEKKVENFENELLKNDNTVLNDDKWFTEGFERNGLIFPYIMNIEYLFDDDNFKQYGKESCNFARYIGVYCNNIEFGEFSNFEELDITDDNAIYYFEDNKNNLHRYVKKCVDNESDNNYKITIDGKDIEQFDSTLISGFEKERITGYAEPLDIYEGFINRAQYGFEILKPFEPGDWVGIEYNGYVECYFADDKNFNAGEKYDSSIGKYSDFRFFVGGKSTVNDIAEALVKSVNINKKSKFEARCSNNVVAFYAKREGVEYNGREDGGAKILMDATLLYNRKISLPISKYVKLVRANDNPIEHISDSDDVYPVIEDSDSDYIESNVEKSSFGDYYMDYFCGACIADINPNTDTYKNVFKIYSDEYVFFDIDRYLKTNNGNGRRINTNMVYIDSNGNIDSEYRVVIVDDIQNDKKGQTGYDVSVSSTYQVEIMDIFKPNHGVLSWFPVKDFDFDINYSTYGQYSAFADECNSLSKKIIYKQWQHINDTNADSDTLSTQETTISGIKELAKSPFFDDYDNSLSTEYDYYNEQILPNLCLVSKTAPYISKWGYYDEQKDSCENPYRLNVNKVFGVSNLSANTYLRNCDENEYTHNMPYYMSLYSKDYSKNYQYIESDEIYRNHYDKDKKEENAKNIGAEQNSFNSISECIDHWIDIFKSTDENMFLYFFSGKKYGKRFDRKYSRLSGGNKLHHPSTLFRGVKFEVVRLYNGKEKRTNEYNDYKFSFVYIPVMIDSMVFSSKVYFVKNDTFKFIVGIIFVNTMIGKFDHNIFNGDVDYFGKGFLYAACKDIIRAENNKKYTFDLEINKDGSNDIEQVNDDNSFWSDYYNVKDGKKDLYLWNFNDEHMFVTKTKNVQKKTDIIGEFVINKSGDSNSIIGDNIKNIKYLETDFSELDVDGQPNEFSILWDTYYEKYDTTIYYRKTFKYYGYLTYKMNVPNIEFNNNSLVDICDIDWEYNSLANNSLDEIGFGYKVDVSNLNLTSESIKNILINMGIKNSVKSIRFHDGGDIDVTYIHEDYYNNNMYADNQIKANITVDFEIGNITISTPDMSGSDSDNSEFSINTYFSSPNRGIESLLIDIVIVDIFDTDYDSFGLKNYFSVFEQISMYSITQHINNDYGVEYISTVVDNKYKIRVVEPDCIEVVDKYESVPLIITQNNKRVLGSVDIKLKQDVDKIGIKTINRYSGFYNPIFNDILYYGDYTYTKTVGRLRTLETFELPYSNTYIDYNYEDEYGKFGVIKNMYYHKTNIQQSDKILTSENPIYPIINEYALGYRDYNVFSSSWDVGYYISQDNLDNSYICEGIGSMKEGLCMFGSKYLNLPDYIFIDTFENGKLWDEKVVIDVRDNTNTEIMYKEINGTSVRYHLFIEKRLKRYLKDKLLEVFSKYINKKYSFGSQETIEDDVEEYVEKNLLKLYKVDKVYMYTKSDRMRINNRVIENDYLKYIDESNEIRIKSGFPVETVAGGVKMKDSKFTVGKVNEFDRTITYNLKPGFKESFGFGISFKRK